jgi:hypothetical protein
VRCLGRNRDYPSFESLGHVLGAQQRLILNRQKRQGQHQVGQSAQGAAVGMSADGHTAIVGGPGDNSQAPQYHIGAAWVFIQGTLQVSPATNIAASGIQGQLFSPTSFNYQLTSTSGSVNYSISGVPPWLIANFTSGTVPPPVTVTFSLNACGLSPGTYPATITFTDTSSGPTRTATLTVNPGTKDDCKDGGWQKFTCSPGPFKNQGQCVSYFAKHKEEHEEEHKEKHKEDHAH